MTSSLADRFRAQAAQCRAHGSPLTAALLDGAASELPRPGPVRDLLGPLEPDPSGSVPSLRFAGALHRLVLEREAPGLALHYPNVGGTAPVDAVWPAARQVLGHPRLPELVRRPVQTNEVGRSAVLLGGLQHLAARTGLPVRLLEVGASAGLNLRVEHFAYDLGGGRVLGDPRSPVRLVDPWRGALPPDVPVHVASRRGCDPGPLDPASLADRLTLTSYVWADQVDRLDRLRGALAVAARVPGEVEPLPASAFLERELAEPRPGVVTVVWHSVVRQYLSPDERARVDALLERVGSAATPAAPLAHLSLEPDRVGDDRFRFAVELTTWPGGAREVLADARGHGPPVVWRAPR